MAKDTKTFKTVETLRKGWLAYIGAYGAAYEQLKPRLASANANTTDLFTMLVTKGEELEATAQEKIEDARGVATDLYGTRFEKVRNLLPTGSNDNSRVAELEAEIVALNKKVASLTKTKKATTAKTPAKKTKKAA